MKNSLSKLLLFVFIFGLGTVFGGIVSLFVFIRITGGTGEPSMPISAPKLSIDTIVTSTVIVQVVNTITPTLLPKIGRAHV